MGLGFNKKSGKYYMCKQTLNAKTGERQSTMFCNDYEGQSKISESCLISDKLLLVWVVFV